MPNDDELVAFDPDSVEGLEAILGAIAELRPQFDHLATWNLAQRRLESLAAAAGYPRPLLAARVFVEHLHPRGPDGRFIEVNAWVRWFDFDSRKWFRGKIVDIDDNTGNVTVYRRVSPKDVGVYRFNPEQASKQLYSQPKTKASIDFPDVMKTGDNEGWKQLAGQGGSNPGGLYELDDNDGVQYHEWTEEELDFLLAGRPSVEVVGFVDTKEQFDDEDYSDRLKEKLTEKYAPSVGEELGAFEQVEPGRRSLGGVIVWDDPEEGPQVAVVNRDDESQQRPTPEGKFRADFALQNWVLRKVKAKFLPQNPERKLHPSWRRIVYGVGPDTGLGVSTDVGVPRFPDLGSETEGVAQAATQAAQTAAEIRNAATGALVSLESIIQIDPRARLFPFEVDADVLGQGDRLQALIKSFIQPSITPGDRFYVKDMSGNHTGPERVANEIMASRLYELAGVAVPDVFQGNDPAKIGSRIIGGELSDIGEHLNDPEVMARVRKDFTVDAWLANWDVAGLDFDNIVVDEGGIPYRIDAGGALAYRAMGSPKGDMFGAEVGELVSLGPESTRSSTAVQMFAGLTQEEKIDGAQRIAGISPQQIRDLGMEVGLDQNTVDTLITRRAFIIDDLLGGVDPFASPSQEQIPEIAEEPDVADLVEPGAPKADLDLIEQARTQVPDTETYDHPVLSERPEAQTVQPEEFPPSVTWNDAWSWSGQSQQWVTAGEVTGAPTEEALEGRWLDRIDELNEQVDQLELSGVATAQMPASELVGSGVLENPRGVILMTDTMAVDGGRTDMFVPWGTDANGNAVLISRISAQTVTPATDWADTRARVRALDMSSLGEELEDHLNQLDVLTTHAADAQVALEAVRTDYRELAAAPQLGRLGFDEWGNDPADLFIVDGDTPARVARTPDGGLLVTDPRTGLMLLEIPAEHIPEPTSPGETATRLVSDDIELMLPDLTGQQIMQAKAEMSLLQQRAGLVDAAGVSIQTPQTEWVQPDPDLDQPDVSLDVAGAGPVPAVSPSVLGGLPDDWDYGSELEPGSYIDTSGPMLLDPEDLGTAHPGLPNTVPIISTIDFEAATDALVDQWVMHDIQDYRFTRQPVRVTEVIRTDDGIAGIAVVYPNGKKGLINGPGLSRLHIVEPPKEARNIPAVDAEIVLGHNGDIRIGKEVVGSWWHADKNISHRHTYGYMVDEGYTAHGKATIGFRSHARDVRKQVRSEVWFADNYEPAEAVSIPKEPGAKTVEAQVKSAVSIVPELSNGERWDIGQPVNKHKAWGMTKADAEGVIVGGVHPNHPNLVYYRDHTTGFITMEDATDLHAHGKDPLTAKFQTGGLFTVGGDTWYIRGVSGDDVMAYSVSDGFESVFKASEIGEVTDPTPHGIISDFEGTFLEGSLSSQEAKDEWTAIGGALLGDGEVPLPGSQLVDGAGKAWRVLRVQPNSLVLASGIEIQQRPAHEFRIDRAHYGGVVGAVGQLQMRSQLGKTIDFQTGKGDVIYASPESFHVLTASGELHTFDPVDGWKEPVLNTEEHGEVIQEYLGKATRVGVMLGGPTSMVLAKDKTTGEPTSYSVVGEMGDANLATFGVNPEALVVSYTGAGPNVIQSPGEGEGGVPLPQGASLAPVYKPVLVVEPEDIQWFDPPVTVRGAREPGEVPRITGATLPEGTWDGKTFPTSENTKALVEAINEVWANVDVILQGGEVEGKTVYNVQFDQGAVEDFYVQVMPVRDTTTGERYVELFFRPLEGHSNDLYNALVAPPPDESEGRWMIPDDVDDVPVTELRLGQNIAVRRGPNGLLTGWPGEGEFGMASVLSTLREIGMDSEGRDIYEFDVALPGGKAATIVQTSGWQYFHEVQWAVPTDEGEEVVHRPGERKPIELSEAAEAAGWRMSLSRLGSQVKHRSFHFDGRMKEIDTNAVHDAEHPGTLFGTGATFQRELGNGTKLWMSVAAPESYRTDHEASNFSRQIYIQIPVERDIFGDEEMAQAVAGAMEAVGIDQSRQELPTPESLSNWAFNTIGQHFGANPDFNPYGADKVGPLMPGRKWNQADIEKLLADEVGPTIGRDVTLADFEYVVDPDGRLMVTASQELAEAISAHAGYISHRHESDVEYERTGGAGLAGKIARVLGFGNAGDNIGPAGRTALGIWEGGQSSDSDMYNGAGNRYYFWTHNTDPPAVRKGGGYDLLIDDEVFQRFLGNGMSSGDNYGRRTGTDTAAFRPYLSWMRMPNGDHNESTLKYGIDGDLVEVIAVPDEVFDEVMTSLRERGVTEVNGRPISDIVVPMGQAISMRERRKARKNRPNSGFYPVVGNVAEVLAGGAMPTAPVMVPPAGVPEVEAQVSVEVPGEEPPEIVAASAVSDPELEGAAT